jgi:TrmH family RNA methyltransferase
VQNVIASIRNDRLRRVRRLLEDRKWRAREGLWVTEGLRLAEEVLREEVVVRLWVIEEGWGTAVAREGELRKQVEGRGDEILTLQRGLLLQVASTQHPQGVLAVVESPCWSVADVFARGGPVVVLDRVQDPGNLGTLARSAEAAGASGVLRTRATVDPGNPKALRASAGSLLRLPSAEVQDPVAAVRAAGLQVMAAEGRAGVPYDHVDLTAPFALLLGQEGSGLSGPLARTADITLTVPMAGRAESLNVAATAAVVLFEAARQRRAAEQRRAPVNASRGRGSSRGSD